MPTIKYHDGTGWKYLPLGAPAPPARVANLPTSGLYDGLEIYYQSTAMATDGIVWHLRYRSAIADAYKWEFVGGSPMLHDVWANYTTTVAAIAWENPASGPILTTPLAGIYDVRAGFEAWHSYGSPRSPQAGIAVGAVADPIADVNNPNWASGFSYAGVSNNVAWEFRTTGIAAGTVLRFYYYRDNVIAYVFRHRFLRLTPVRVG